MASTSSPDTLGSSPTGTTSGSTSMNSKGTASPANEVELKTMRSDAPKGSIPLGEDIMQLARIGEIPAMQNLFATKKLTANHRDEEGITPLHVCFRSTISPRCVARHTLSPVVYTHRRFIQYLSSLDTSLTRISFLSGRPSTTNMPCASSCSTRARTSTPRAANR